MLPLCYHLIHLFAIVSDYCLAEYKAFSPSFGKNLEIHKFVLDKPSQATL